MINITHAFSIDVWKANYGISLPKSSFSERVLDVGLDSSIGVIHHYNEKDLITIKSKLMKIGEKEKYINQELERLLSYMIDIEKDKWLQVFDKSLISFDNYYLIVEKNYRLSMIIFDIKTNDLYEVSAVDLSSRLS